MILIFVLIYIGISFHSLAEKYNKSVWLYVVIGIVTYLAATFITGMIMGLILFAIGKDIASINNFLLELIGVPFALLTCYGLRLILKKSWEKKLISHAEGVLDDIEFKD